MRFLPEAEAPSVFNSPPLNLPSGGDALLRVSKVSVLKPPDVSVCLCVCVPVCVSVCLSVSDATMIKPAERTFRFVSFFSHGFIPLRLHSVTSLFQLTR